MSTTEHDDPYALTKYGIQEPPATLWQALRKIGPGIVLAGSIIGSGELLLTTALGAQYGFIFLWLILFSCVIKVFVQIELGRYTISSGLPTLSALDRLPGPRLGAHWLVWWWFIMLLMSVSQLGGMVGGVGQAMDLAFPQVSQSLANACEGISPAGAELLRSHPEYSWAVLTAVAAVLLLLSGGYKRIETATTFLVAGVTAVTVVCVMMLPRSGYGVTASDLREGFSLGVLTLGAGAITQAFSAFGITGVGANELYAYPYWCVEKGYARYTGPQSSDDEWVRRAKGWLRVMYLDAWVSMVVFTVATVAFYVLGATILHRQGLNPEKSKMIETLSEMYVPTFGPWTKIFFLIGVFAVLFKTLYVASAGHARLSADFMGLTWGPAFQGAAARSKWTSRFCVFYPMLALLLFFFFTDPKIMVVIGGFVQAVTLPIIAGAAIYLRYYRVDRRLAPSLLSDLCMWLAFITITGVTVAALLWPLFVSAKK